MIDRHIIRTKVNGTHIDWDAQSEGDNTESTSDGDERQCYQGKKKQRLLPIVSIFQMK